MPAEYRLPRSAIALTRWAVFLAAGVVPTAAWSQTSNVQALMIGTAWVGWMNQAQVLETPLATGGTGAQVTVQTNYVSPSLLDFISLSLAGKVSTTPLQLATYTSSGAAVSLMKLLNTRLQEVDLPAVDARSSSFVLVGVKFAQAPYETAVPTTHPMSNPIGQVLHSNLFHLQFDSLDATSAMAIGRMTVLLPNVMKGVDLPQLALTYAVSATNLASENFAKGLQKWFLSQTTRNGTLTFLASDMRTALLVVRFRGLRVTANTAGTSTPTATFSMTGISVQGPVAP